MTPRTDRKDPTCSTHCDRYVGRVSWPANLPQGWPGPSASTYVCGDEAHQADAAEWVEAVTGHRGVFVPWASSPAPAVQDSMEALADGPGVGKTSVKVDYYTPRNLEATDG